MTPQDLQRLRELCGRMREVLDSKTPDGLRYLYITVNCRDLVDLCSLAERLMEDTTASRND